jgi:hypothetical protein
VTKSYSGAFELFIVINLVGALAVYGCKSFASESDANLVLAEPASA